MNCPTSWNTRYAASVMNTFGPPALVLTEGQGTRVRDISGKEYLDLLGGIAVNTLGYAHPVLVEAITTQVQTLGHVSNFFATPPQIQLAEKLLDIIEPGGASEDSRVFFANSGTEANEAALKIVKAHARRFSPVKTKILALNNAFHGRTCGALSLTWKDAYRAPFAPLIPGVEFIPANDLAALEEAMNEDVAGVFIEPIQGEAGVLPLDTSYLQAVREFTSSYDALMVVDEVQTGVGRSGEWMSHHPCGVLPDIVTVAKGLGGGIPIGACIALGAVAKVLGPGMHGTTFGGNPIAAAAALAVLQVIESEGLLAKVKQNSQKWRSELARVEGVREVRGRGYLIGVECEAPIAAGIVAAGRDAGFILNATGPSTLRLAPPLILSQEEARSFTQALPSLISAAQEAQQ